MLESKLRSLCVLGKHSSTELHPHLASELWCWVSLCRSWLAWTLLCSKAALEFGMSLLLLPFRCLNDRCVLACPAVLKVTMCECVRCTHEHARRGQRLTSRVFLCYSQGLVTESDAHCFAWLTSSKLRGSYLCSPTLDYWLCCLAFIYKRRHIWKKNLKWRMPPYGWPVGKSIEHFLD